MHSKQEASNDNYSTSTSFTRLPTLTHALWDRWTHDWTERIEVEAPTGGLCLQHPVALLQLHNVGLFHCEGAQHGVLHITCCLSNTIDMLNMWLGEDRLRHIEECAWAGTGDNQIIISPPNINKMIHPKLFDVILVCS